MADPVLHCADVTKSFGGLLALNDVDLDVERGTIHGIIGPNGAGKTTLFNVITGFYTPTAGTIRFDGRDITALPVHERTRLGIARTFQNIRLFEEMPVLANVLVGQHARVSSGLRSVFMTVSTEERRARARAVELLNLLDLSEYRDRDAGTLPYGLQRVLEIGRALATEPSLLLLDEPSAGMNPAEKENFSAQITRLRQHLDLTILLIEHDMSVVMGLSDVVTVLNFGEMIAEGRPEVIQRNGRVIEAYLGREE